MGASDGGVLRFAPFKGAGAADGQDDDRRMLAGLAQAIARAAARPIVLHTKIHADLTVVRSAWIFFPGGRRAYACRGTRLAAVAYRAYHPAQAYAMCMPPWPWWWWWPKNTGATWLAPGAAVGAGAGTEAACAMGMAPNSIAPATALAPAAPTARRRAEESEIDILLLLKSFGD